MKHVENKGGGYLQEDLVVAGLRALVPKADRFVKVAADDLHAVARHQIVAARAGELGRYA